MLVFIMLMVNGFDLSFFISNSRFCIEAERLERFLSFHCDIMRILRLKYRSSPICCCFVLNFILLQLFKRNMMKKENAEVPSVLIACIFMFVKLFIECIRFFFLSFCLSFFLCLRKHFFSVCC